VLQAENPLDNVVRWGRASYGSVRILVDVEGTPLNVARDFKLSRDRWLVRGMEIPVAIEPSKPDAFEIEWEAIPGIEERVAANDPTLADPMGAGRKVAEAMRSAGLLGPDTNSLPGGIGQLVARSEKARKEGTPDRFAEAMDRAASEPAPPDKSRAVVLIVTALETVVEEGGDPDGGGGHSARRSSGKHDAVLAVNVPGRDPYAVLARRFKRPSHKTSITAAGLPALVSSTDPNDVEVLWGEIPSTETQIEQRIADRMQGVAAGMREQNEMSEQMTEALRNASKDPQGPVPTPGASPIPQLGKDAQAMMAANAKRALQFVQDPATRKMLIQQYRAAGIDVDESDEAP
jgi:hypothetical protein